MENHLDYSSAARRFESRYPLLSSLMTQISFWIIANAVLGVIIHLYVRSLVAIYPLIGVQRLGPVLIFAMTLGALYGTTLGLLDHYIGKFSFQNRSIGQIILVKTVLSITTLTAMLWLILDKLHDILSARLSFSAALPGNDEFWHYVLVMLVVYYLFMTLIINLAIQVNKKFGPGILLPLLWGKFRNPREQERVFLFMDLKSSTSMAETCGHLKYSAFIRDSFYDINQVIPSYNAEVYQYVGDEIVMSWPITEGLRKLACVHFFFACEKQFEDKAKYYLQNYGRVPQFKAGLHMGTVVAVEIGDIKRDIAYHGDTLNTAARLQSLCNDYDRKLLTSEYLLRCIGAQDSFIMERLGMIQLKGKAAPTGVVSVELIRKP